MQDEGLIRHLGLSEVTVEEIQAAQEVFEVATVQNLYNLVNRGAEDVLDYCEQQGIGFIPWFPLAAGGLAAPRRPVAEAAARARRDARPGRARLAAAAQPGDAADPGHGLGGAPGGERRRRRHPAHPGRGRRARRRGRVSDAGRSVISPAGAGDITRRQVARRTTLKQLLPSRGP